MKVICVDADRETAEKTAEVCRFLPRIDEAFAFDSVEEALSFMDHQLLDIAILDIAPPKLDGLRLAAAMKEKQPYVSVIFLTEHPEYALDAFRVRASGYLLKPLSEEALEDEVDYAASVKRSGPGAHISVQTFGGFDVFVDGTLVHFKRSKSKELFAILVDRRGSSVTRAEIFSILWEDRFYDRPMQKQLDVTIRSMRDTLREYGISEVVEMKRGHFRIFPEQISCDLYRFFDGDEDAFNAYRGEYMNPYAWASITEGSMAWQ